MKKLLVISNHAPEKWSDSQKAGWYGIEYIPFPNVPPDMSSADVIEKLAIPICSKIGEFMGKCDEDGAEGFVTIQGEFSLCKAVFDSLHGEDIRWVFPTTERKTFEFVQWRQM